MAENNITYYQSRHTGAQIDDILDQSIAATAAAEASSAKAEAAAENANQEAAKIPGMVVDLSDVLAASDCSLKARVATLERILSAVLSGTAVIPKLQVNELGVWGPNNLILTGSGAPTKAPDRAGQFYIDTASEAVYKSTGNAAVADWKNL